MTNTSAALVTYQMAPVMAWAAQMLCVCTDGSHVGVAMSKSAGVTPIVWAINASLLSVPNSQ